MQERFDLTDAAAGAFTSSKYLGYLLGPRASIITGGQHPVHHTVIRGALLAVALLGIAYFPGGDVSGGWLTGRSRADGMGATDESARLLLGSGKENLHDTED